MKIQNEQGRTMLEMLGVISIIGIITYGAIAGIGYGMQTYKINQTYNDIQDIIQGVEDLYSWSRSGYPSNITAAVHANGIFSGDIKNSGCAGGPCLTGQFGDMWITGEDSGRTFMVKVKVLDETARTRLSTMDWNSINIDQGSEGDERTTLTFTPSAN